MRFGTTTQNALPNRNLPQGGKFHPCVAWISPIACDQFHSPKANFTATLRVALFQNVLHALCENGVDMVVCQRVVDSLARAAELDQARLLEYAKLM